MSEQTNLPVPSEVTVTAQFSIAFTKHGVSVQKIQNEINSLDFTEENMPRISELINLVKSANKVIDETHKEGKAPYLSGGKVWDLSKNTLLAINEGLLNQLTPKFNQLCAAVEKRRIDAENERLRISAIKTGIESNVISFSSQIAQCDTNAQLLSVERMINLEKSESRKSKYMEFHNDAIERYDTVLLPILKDQKEKIKEKEALEKKILEAENANDAAKIDELNEKKDQIDNEILQNQVNVQQDAVNSPVSFDIPVAEEIFPDVKAVNRISFEIVDINTAVKKCPELLTIEIKHREAQKLAMTLKDAGTFKDKSEVVVNGIKFFIDKSFRP